jgi:hypothetical protein
MGARYNHRPVPLPRAAKWLALSAAIAVLLLLVLGISSFFYTPSGTALDWQEQLYRLDAATGTLTEVASHTGRLGGPPGAGLWRAKDQRWDGGDVQPPQ